MALETEGPEKRREGESRPGMTRPVREDRPIGVLIVDDDPLVRTLLAEIVNRENDIAILGAATDGLDASNWTEPAPLLFRLLMNVTPPRPVSDTFQVRPPSVDL